MSAFLDLLGDNASVAGRLVTTAALAVLALLVAMAVRWLVGRRADDAYTRYYLRKAVNVLVVVALLVTLAVVWRPFAGRIAIILGYLQRAGLQQQRRLRLPVGGTHHPGALHRGLAAR